jgi:hypothetical protein
MMDRYVAWPTGQRDLVIARIASHRAADEIIQGEGWDGERGCAVGCSLDHYCHTEYVAVLGVPPQIAHLVDAIHEGLPRDLALDWPGRVAAALAEGADTTHAWTRFSIRLLRKECPSSSGAAVASLYERRLAGDEPSRDDWHAVRSAVRSAVRAAAAARAAAWAAWAAWAAAARAAADSACYQRQADALIAILQSCEVARPARAGW